MTVHRLKTLPDYWEAVASGDKNFEVRRDDRGFQKGDILELVRIPRTENGIRTDGWGPPEMLRRRVTWVLTGGQLGIEPGYVVMGLAPTVCGDPMPGDG